MNMKRRKATGKPGDAEKMRWTSGLLEDHWYVACRSHEVIAKRPAKRPAKLERLLAPDHPQRPFGFGFGFGHRRQRLQDGRA